MKLPRKEWLQIGTDRQVNTMMRICGNFFLIYSHFSVKQEITLLTYDYIRQVRGEDIKQSSRKTQTYVIIVHDYSYLGLSWCHVNFRLLISLLTSHQAILMPCQSMIEFCFVFVTQAIPSIGSSACRKLILSIFFIVLCQQICFIQHTCKLLMNDYYWIFLFLSVFDAQQLIS